MKVILKFVLIFFFCYAFSSCALEKYNISQENKFRQDLQIADLHEFYNKNNSELKSSVSNSEIIIQYPIITSRLQEKNNKLNKIKIEDRKLAETFSVPKVNLKQNFDPILTSADCKKIKTNLKDEPDNKPVRKRTHPLAAISLLCALFTIAPVLGFIFILPAIILGIIALNRIKKKPDIYKGRGLAIAAIIIPIAVILFIIIYIATVGLNLSPGFDLGNIH